MTNKSLEFTAPGKVILCGEHAVVYGYPAIITSIDRFFTWKIHSSDPNFSAEQIRQTIVSHKHKLLAFSNLEEVVSYVLTLFPTAVKIHSTIPSGSGLGSSAALGVSLAKLLLPDSASHTEIRQLSLEFEKIQHGSPSGGDITASCYGGLIWYQKNLIQNTWEFTQLTAVSTNTLPKFWLVDSGKPQESTREMIEQVASLREKRKKHVDAAFSKMESVANAWKKAFSTERSEFPTSIQETIHTLLHENQLALQEIGICSDKSLELISSLQNIGAAAKITGAGGVQQGSGMILITHADPEKIASWAKKRKLQLLPISLAQGEANHV